MDPFSITIGAVTLAAQASRAGVELKKLQYPPIKSETISELLADLKGLRIILRCIEDGVEDLDSQTPRTDDMGAFWSALEATLNDEQYVMSLLIGLLSALNQQMHHSVKVQGNIRIDEANRRIMMHRQHIQVYKDAFQLSLQAITLIKQTTMNKDTMGLAPSSDCQHQDPITLAADLHFKLSIRLSALKMEYVGRGDVVSISGANIQRLRNLGDAAKTSISNASANYSHATEEQPPESFEHSLQSDWVTELSAPHGDKTLTWNAPQNFEHRPSSRSSVSDPSETETMEDPEPQAPIPNENKKDDTQVDVTPKTQIEKGRTWQDHTCDMLGVLAISLLVVLLSFMYLAYIRTADL